MRGCLASHHSLNNQWISGGLTPKKCFHVPEKWLCTHRQMCQKNTAEKHSGEKKEIPYSTYFQIFIPHPGATFSD